MKIIFLIVMLINFAQASDATIDVIKKVEALPNIAVEDATLTYDETFKLTFFKSIVADLNVLSIFNVDRHYKTGYFGDDVVVENKDTNYVLKYEMDEGDAHSLIVKVVLLKNREEVFSKTYRVGDSTVYMFVSHAIAYDLNEFMGEPSVEWMKRKVIFSRIVAPRKSEIVIADYTLSYQKVVVQGGFSVFPKWANDAQNAFYYTSLDANEPKLLHVDLRTAKVTSLLSSQGMLVCSDVSKDGTQLLLTMAKYGQPDIFVYDTKRKRYKRVTTYSGIDVNGQFLDKNKIVFISNRLGYPNVFSKKIGSPDVEQMVYYGNSNSACSVHGDYIVYKARESSNSFSKNTFNLHLISQKTDFIRRLTATGVNEFPKFSKDGDAILFIKSYKFQSSIGIIRLAYNKNYLFPLKSGKIQSMDW